MIYNYRFNKNFYFLFLNIFFILIYLPGTGFAQTQIFLETFGNTTPGICDQGSLANGFTSQNGSWTVTQIGVQDSAASVWYISATEPGREDDSCALPGCYINASNTDRTLHIGNAFNSPNAAIICPTGDCGAVYDAGGFQNSVQTEKRAESPLFSMQGQTTNVIEFSYFEYGDSTVNNDNMLLDFYNGNTWVTITDPPRTNICGTGSVTWKKYAYTLPSIAITSDVKIGFRWKNDNGIGGTNKSCAIDSISVYSFGGSPVAHITASDTDICAGQCLTFIADTVGPFPSYDWTFPGAIPPSSTQQNPSFICYLSPGTYPVTLTVNTATGSDTATISIVVNPCSLPTADFISSDTLICEQACINFTDMSINGPNAWSWSFPGGIPSSSSSPNPPPVCYDSSGTYDVMLVASNQFGADTILKTAYLQVDSCPVSVSDLNNSGNRIKLFLNPESTLLSVSMDENFESDLEISIYDIVGKLVISKPISGNKNNEIEISSLRNGTYLVMIHNGSEQFFKEEVVIVR